MVASARAGCELCAFFEAALAEVTKSKWLSGITVAYHSMSSRGFQIQVCTEEGEQSVLITLYQWRGW